MGIPCQVGGVFGAVPLLVIFVRKKPKVRQRGGVSTATRTPAAIRRLP